MSAIGFIFSKLLLQMAVAATFDVAVQEGDRLVLIGMDANVHFVGQGGKTLRINGVEPAGVPVEGVYTLAKKDKVVEVRIAEFSGKRTWLNAVSKRSPQPPRIEISGASIPVEVRLREGSVTFQRWAQDIQVSLTNGKLVSANGMGFAQLYVQKGDINVQEHTGKVEADEYNGTMLLKNIQGDVEASLFAGQLQIEKVRGFVSVTTQQSNSKVLESSGTIQFENGKGTLNIQSFLGRIEGQSQDGAVTLGMVLDSEADIKTKAGKVQVQLPPASGAHLNLHSSEGEIVVPSELKVSKFNAERSVRGRLRGDAQRVSLFVRSQEGVISVK